MYRRRLVCPGTVPRHPGAGAVDLSPQADDGSGHATHAAGMSRNSAALSEGGKYRGIAPDNSLVSVSASLTTVEVNEDERRGLGGRRAVSALPGESAARNGGNASATC